MMDLHSNLIIDGYEIMNDEGTVLVDSEGCQFKFLTYKDANEFLEALKKSGIDGKTAKIKLTIPEG